MVETSESWRLRPGCAIHFSDHAIGGMLERNISEKDVREALLNAQAVEHYPAEGYPYPNYLLLGPAGPRWLHVVNADKFPVNEVIVVSVYEPDLLSWDENLRQRRKP